MDKETAKKYLGNFRFMKLNGKIPKHSFNYPYEFGDVSMYPDLGVIVDKPYIIVDFDDSADFQAARRTMLNLGIKTRTMFSSRGGHMWFKHDEHVWPESDVKLEVAQLCALGLMIDIRAFTKKSQVVVKNKDIWREWENFDDVASFPDFLKPLNANASTKFANLGNGGGRNDALFKWIIQLLKNGFKRDRISQIAEMINNFVFAEPLSVVEMENIAGDKNKIFDTFQITEDYSDPKQHNIFGNRLAKEYDIKSKHEKLYIYNNGRYAPDESYILNLMITKNEGIKDSQRLEILKYLKIKEIYDFDEKVAKNYLNCKNGLLNLNTGVLEEHTPSIFDPNQINTVYDPNAKEPFVDKVLLDLANGDVDVFVLFCEVIGYVLIKDCWLEKSFLMYGGGSNGKSVFGTMLTNMLGNTNVTNVSLEQLHQNYMAGELAGKMLCYGSDISKKPMDETQAFKKLVTGETTMARGIYEKPFELTNYAKMIFNSNGLVLSNDRSVGFYRRWVMIPFMREFKKQNADDEKHFINMLTSENAKSYLLNLGLAGLKRLKENGRFTEPKVVKDLMTKTKKANSSIMTWLDYVSVDELKNRNALDCYLEYKSWCETVKLFVVPLALFDDEFNKVNGYNLEIKGLFIVEKERK